MTALVAIAVTVPGIAFAILVARFLLGGLLQAMFRASAASYVGSRNVGRLHGPGQAAGDSIGGA